MIGVVLALLGARAVGHFTARYILGHPPQAEWVIWASNLPWVEADEIAGGEKGPYVFTPGEAGAILVLVEWVWMDSRRSESEAALRRAVSKAKKKKDVTIEEVYEFLNGTEYQSMVGDIISTEKRRMRALKTIGGSGDLQQLLARGRARGRPDHPVGRRLRKKGLI